MLRRQAAYDATHATPTRAGARVAHAERATSTRYIERHGRHVVARRYATVITQAFIRYVAAANRAIARRA